MPQKRNGKAQLAVTVVELQNAVADGWIIDPPVERKQIPDRPDGDWYCHVILWREGRVRVLTVPDDALLRQFLGEHDLTVAGQE
jgi:hypothetical protein